MAGRRYTLLCSARPRLILLREDVVAGVRAHACAGPERKRGDVRPLIVNSAPDGREGPYNSLRLADAPALRAEHVEVIVIGAAVVATSGGQDPCGAHASLGHLLAGLLERGVEVNRCGTSCTTRRGTEEQFATHACATSDRGRLDGIVRDDRVVSL